MAVGAATCASAGIATMIAAAATAVRNWLARIGGRVHLDFDGAGRNLVGAAGKEVQQPDDQEDDDDEKNNCSRHGTRVCFGWNETAFAVAAGRCIALLVGNLTERLDRPIVLVGLMGAGKSTVGRRLAKRLGLPYIDTDAAIAESTAGYTPAEVFERFGEADFRDGERRLVARLVDDQVRVIATGGEVFVDPRTREMLNNRTITVWLDAPVDLLTNRTGRLETRPLLRNVDRRETLERLAAERRELYAEAHIHVKSGDGAHGEVVDKIVVALDKHLNGHPPEASRSR